MIKRLLFVLALVVGFTAATNAQWTKSSFGNPVADTLKGSSGAHGITVDPDGNVWVAQYATLVKDTVLIPDSAKYFQTKQVYVFKPDGTPASFSPVRFYKNGTDMKVFGAALTGIHCRKDGLIILSAGTQLFGLDYKTGLGKFYYKDVASLNKAATDDAGNVYLSHVLPGNPLVVLNPDFTYNSNAVDTIPAYGRTLEVSADGNTIYSARYTVPGILVFKRASEFDPYVKTDTLAKGFQCESMGWNKVNKALYASCGSPSQPPWKDPVVNPGGFWYKATIPTHYGIDVAKKTIIDSLSWVLATDQSGANEQKPRGIAFSPNGKTAYLVEFNNSAAPCVQVFKTTNLPGTGVEKVDNNVVNNYSLSNNYPNPFNPTTEIKFSVAKDGFVSLKVYDMLGKEVATLANGQMTAGNYTTTFNAAGLNSGVYVYSLSVNGVVLSHKMTLMK